MGVGCRWMLNDFERELTAQCPARGNRRSRVVSRRATCSRARYFRSLASSVDNWRMASV